MSTLWRNRNSHSLDQQYRLFLIGIAIGIIIAWIQLTLRVEQDQQQHRLTRPKENSFLQTTKTNTNGKAKEKAISNNNSTQIPPGPRILCFVLTKPENHKTKAIYIKQTWGKRCNILLFMSSIDNDTLLETVKINVPNGRKHLYQKTKASFQYVHEHYRNDADWFLKADDDTYVVVEHLRSFLGHYIHTEPVYFGCNFRPYVPQGYMSGGAGYVLSREALGRYSYGVYSGVPSCVRRAAVEDVQIGRCLYSLGVISGDSRDQYGSYRFLPFNLATHMSPYLMSRSKWYLDYIKYPQPQGQRCCSGDAISFHYVTQPMMYAFEYFLYVLRLS